MFFKTFYKCVREMTDWQQIQCNYQYNLYFLMTELLWKIADKHWLTNMSIRYKFYKSDNNCTLEKSNKLDRPTDGGTNVRWFLYPTMRRAMDKHIYSYLPINVRYKRSIWILIATWPPPPSTINKQQTNKWLAFKSYFGKTFLPNQKLRQILKLMVYLLCLVKASFSKLNILFYKIFFIVFWQVLFTGGDLM